MLTKLQSRYRYSVILLRELVITGFKLRYQGSVLGYLWSLLKPIFLFTILYVVFVNFLKIGKDDPTWPVSLMLGIVLWTFFAEVTSGGLTSVVDRGDVIRKINFPKYVIVLSTSVLALINLVLNFIVIAVLMVVNQIPLTWSTPLLALYILELFIFGLGLSFLMSALFVKLRDMNYIWEIIMQALFYSSIVMYPLSMVLNQSEQFAKMLLLNPIAHAIQGSRHVFVNAAQNPTLRDLADNPFVSSIPIIIVCVTIVFGAWYFRRRSPYFAEEI